MRKQITNKWFFSDVPVWLKVLQIFIKGDLLVIFPFLIFLMILLYLNLEIGIIVAAVFFSLRQIGEMFYWIMQQFSSTGYRPYDFGLKNVSNKGIYIVYQLLNLIAATAGIGILIYLLILS